MQSCTELSEEHTGASRTSKQPPSKWFFQAGEDIFSKIQQLTQNPVPEPGLDAA